MHSKSNGIPVGCGVLVLLWALGSTLPCLGSEGPVSYVGPGTVHVIEDGRVVVDYGEKPDETFGLEIEDATYHHLISDGTLFTLLQPGAPLPPNAKTSVPLDGTGCSVIGQFAGTLSVKQLKNGSWSVEVFDTEKITFSYQFEFKKEDTVSVGVSDTEKTTLSYQFRKEDTVQNAGAVQDGCDATCGDKSCSCSGPGICWCFCGIFGEPNCIHIRLLFAMSSV